MERNTKWILLASLLVNAVLVGFIAGHMGRGGPLGGMGPFNRRMPPMMMQGRADEDTRAVLKSAFETERPALDKALKDVVDARRESEEILRTDPLDMARLDAAMAKL